MAWGWDTRIKIALVWEIKVAERYEDIGFKMVHFGQGGLQNNIRKILRASNRDNIMTKYIRYLPDWVATLESHDVYFYVEAKTCTKKYKGPEGNYSYELDSYNSGMFSYKLGAKIVVVFDGWRADYIQNLDIIDTYTDKKWIEDNVKTGSGTFWGLIKKSSIPTFNEFMEREFGDILPGKQSTITRYPEPKMNFDLVIKIPDEHFAIRKLILDSLKNRCLYNKNTIAFNISELDKLNSLLDEYNIYKSPLVDDILER